jgi:hypothetical protein
MIVWLFIFFYKGLWKRVEKMRVVMKRSRLALKFIGLSVFVIPGSLALLYGILNIDIMWLLFGLVCMFFLPIFLRAAIYFIKPKVVFTVEDGLIKSGQQAVKIDSLKGFYHFWSGSSSYLGLVEKDDTVIEIELFNMVEPEDYSEELQKYIPYIEPNWEEEEEMTL